MNTNELTFETKEEINDICERLAGITDIIMAMESHREHGGAITRESLELISDVTYNCKKRLEDILSAKDLDACAS